jgi:hypothetical protein
MPDSGHDLPASQGREHKNDRRPPTVGDAFYVSQWMRILKKLAVGKLRHFGLRVVKFTHTANLKGG